MEVIKQDNKIIINKKKVSNRLLVILLFIATIFMSVGYASVNSVIVNVNGLGSVAAADSSVHISAATPVSNNVTINNFAGTMLNSTVDLTNNGSESITITISNNTNETVYFNKVAYDTQASLFYDNPNITFSLSNLSKGDAINPGQSKTFSITFTYVNGFTPTVPSDRVLNSYINFIFSKQYSVTYNNIDTLNKNYPLTALENDSLEVSFYGDVPYDVRVTSGGNTLTSGTDYTYIVDPNNANNKKLTIPNVSDDIIIDRYYSITYVLNNGTNNPSNPTKFLSNDSISILDPTYTGYFFDGWYTLPGLTGTKITSTSGLNADTTLYAKWLPIYNITYTLNGGTNPSNQITEFTLDYPQNILDAYHTHDEEFSGFYQNSGFTGQVVSSTSSLSGNSNLYAKFTNTIANTTYSDSTYRYTASNVTNDSSRNFRNRSYTQNTAHVGINSINLYLTLSHSNGAKVASVTCQVTSNTPGFATASSTASIQTSDTSASLTLTPTNPIQSGYNYTISCPTFSDGNGKWSVTKFEFLINP